MEPFLGTLLDHGPDAIICKSTPVIHVIVIDFFLPPAGILSWENLPSLSWDVASEAEISGEK